MDVEGVPAITAAAAPRTLLSLSTTTPVMAPPPAAPSAASKTPAAKGKALANASASSGGPSKRGKRAPKGQQQQAAPPATERERPAGGGGGAAPPKLKIVVRRLPANIPEEIFWSSTAQWVNDETAGWKVFRKGKVAKAYVAPALLSSSGTPELLHLTQLMPSLNAATRSRRTRELTFCSRTRLLYSTFTGATMATSSATRPVRPAVSPQLA